MSTVRYNKRNLFHSSLLAPGCRRWTVGGLCILLFVLNINSKYAYIVFSFTFLKSTYTLTLTLGRRHLYGGNNYRCLRHNLLYLRLTNAWTQSYSQSIAAGNKVCSKKKAGLSGPVWCGSVIWCREFYQNSFETLFPPGMRVFCLPLRGFQTHMCTLWHKWHIWHTFRLSAYLKGNIIFVAQVYYMCYDLPANFCRGIPFLWNFKLNMYLVLFDYVNLYK